MADSPGGSVALVEEDGGCEGVAVDLAQKAVGRKSGVRVLVACGWEVDGGTSASRLGNDRVSWYASESVERISPIYSLVLRVPPSSPELRVSSSSLVLRVVGINKVQWTWQRHSRCLKHNEGADQREKLSLAHHDDGDLVPTRAQVPACKERKGKSNESKITERKGKDSVGYFDRSLKDSRLTYV